MEDPHRFAFGAFQLDIRDERLWRGSNVIRLKPKALAVLRCLLTHAGQLVTKDVLFTTVWPETVVSDAVLAAAIRELRRALGDSARRPYYIETVHGRGYRFIAAVKLLPQESAASSALAVPPVDDASQLCPTCQHVNAIDASFCNACAAPLRGDMLQATAADPLTAVMPADAGTVFPSKTMPPQEAERRQLTVMFCDLVASPPLAETLDPEELREVIHNYQATCASVIDAFEGYIAQYLGDGLLAYFGYPQAHEDDAQRAVRVGLGMLAAMAALNDHLEHTHGVRLAVRIGIHTGLVVVGGLDHRGRQEPLALGVTPNVAARLQGLASPNTLVVSAATHHLVQGYFMVEDLGMHILPGVSTPMQVLRVVRERAVRSRLEAASTHGLTAFVGRAPEVALLRDRWASVTAGRGQVVVVSGEAGIGKSRLVQVFKDDVALGSYTPIECHTSPYAQHSALYPVVDLIERMLEWDFQDTPATKLEKLEAMLAPLRLPVHETVPLLASLLSFAPPEDRYPPLLLAPERQRQKLFEVFVLHVLEQAERQPVLFILEDLHWSDPSTLELLGLLMAQVPATSIMMLFTCRPEFDPPWGFRSHLTPIALHRLPRAQIELMIDRVTGGKALPTELIEQLIDKTDGVPLFIEEMTKAVLESGQLHAINGQYTLTGPAAVTIPTSLQDSLMARLDRLTTAKGIAQMGAAIGRQFSYTLLQAIAQRDDATLQQELRQLVEAELVFQSGLPPQATYTFKHALIQDTAYQSLLRRRRQQVHQQIAQVLEAQIPETVETQPELLAHHYTEAGLIKQAIPYWQRAGEHAGARSAYAEAIAHLTKGLEVVPLLADTYERAQPELQLQIALGDALTVTQGYTAPAVKYAYTRALTLCEHLPDSPQRFAATYGLWRYYNLLADLQTDRQLAEQLVSLAEQQHNPLFLMQGHFAIGETLFRLGDLVSSLAHLEQSLALVPGQPSDAWADVAGTRVACLVYIGWIVWHRGYATQALCRTQEALTLAQALTHPFTLGFAQAQAIITHQFRRDYRATQAGAEALITLSADHDFPFWLAYGRMLRGWAIAMQGQPEEGVTQIREGFDVWQRTGAKLEGSYFLSLLADGYGEHEQIETGLRTLEEALAAVATTEERWWEAEVHRLKGVLLLKRPSDHAAEAETCFHNARDMARLQQAKSLELRAATSLSHLWKQQGKREQAYDLLAPIYNWFTEGFDTADLQAAKALLGELGK
jgi:predicted ATPase/class 3 adenylate cyclase/DNA-binding winged helix-turn-helix (wHTH) protein